MPAVPCGNQHGIEVRALGQKLGHVVVQLAVLVAVMVVCQFLGPETSRPVQIAGGHHLNVLFLHHPAQVMAAAAADADAPHDDLFTGRHAAITAQHAAGHDRRQGQQAGRLFEKGTACCLGFVLFHGALQYTFKMGNSPSVPLRSQCQVRIVRAKVFEHHDGIRF